MKLTLILGNHKMVVESDNLKHLEFFEIYTSGRWTIEDKIVFNEGDKFPINSFNSLLFLIDPWNYEYKDEFIDDMIYYGMKITKDIEPNSDIYYSKVGYCDFMDHKLPTNSLHIMITRKDHGLIQKLFQYIVNNNFNVIKTWKDYELYEDYILKYSDNFVEILKQIPSKRIFNLYYKQHKKNLYLETFYEDFNLFFVELDEILKSHEFNKEFTLYVYKRMNSLYFNDYAFHKLKPYRKINKPYTDLNYREIFNINDEDVYYYLKKRLIKKEIENAYIYYYIPSRFM